MTEFKLLIVEDDLDFANALLAAIKSEDLSLTLAVNHSSAMKLLEQQNFDLILTDVNLGEKKNGVDLLRFLAKNNIATPVCIMTAYANVSDSVSSLKLGAVDYLEKPFPIRKLKDLIEKYRVSEHIAIDPKSKKVFEQALSVASSDINVLLTGASGTGKEVVARYIHNNSNRSSNAFIAINCGAIPETMVESILFGHEKGSFTGAYTSQPGVFERADQGTLFLDEVSELPLMMQVKLLRVIQEKTVERLGGKKQIPVDFRLVTATNLNLQKMVMQNKFRRDLYFRLNVISILLPELRERSEDLPELIKLFLSKYCTKFKRTLPSIEQSFIKELLKYSWPGNIRELENFIQRLLISCKNDVFTKVEAKEYLLNEETIDGKD